MENIEYANAYSEVLEILKNISKEDYEKVPSEKIDLFEKNANKNYNFQYDTNLTLDEQNVSKRAKAIIAILFRDYWATPEQREKILAKQNYDRIQIEKNKQKQYNVDNIFKNKERKVETVENSVSMVEYKDGAVIAQLGTPDMKLPIQYALFYPERRYMPGDRLDFTKLSSIVIETPDMDIFLGLRYAYEAIGIGGSMPTVFNAANEYAVKQFLDRKIDFLDIYDIIRASMDHHNLIENPDIDEILATEQEVYEFIESGC